MRYIGSKARVIGFLDDTIHCFVKRRKGLVFADLFSGTTVVAQHFKKMGYRIITNDYMAFSYVLQVAFIKNNRTPTFRRLRTRDYKDVLNQLNALEPFQGFFYRNYCKKGSLNGEFQRNYFSVENACKIDAILRQLRIWRDKNLISLVEDAILRASLIDAVTKVSNISGTYGAFLRYNDPRKFKRIKLQPLEFIPSEEKHACFNENIMTLIDKLSGDILYLDPPYNQRQYPPYYHILETVSLDDNPAIYGKTGRRPYKDKLSPFCIKNKAREALCSVVRRARFEHIFISYNTEGLLAVEDIERVLSKWGTPKVCFWGYRRYRSNSNGKNHNSVKETLFYVRKKNFRREEKGFEEAKLWSL